MFGRVGAEPTAGAHCGAAGGGLRLRSKRDAKRCKRDSKRGRIRIFISLLLHFLILVKITAFIGIVIRVYELAATCYSLFLAQVFTLRFLVGRFRDFIRSCG